MNDAAGSMNLLQALRLAMVASIGLSFLTLADSTAHKPGSLLPGLLLHVLLFKLPYVAVFWLTRAGPDRKGVALALSFGVVSFLHSLGSDTIGLLYALRLSSLQVRYLMFMPEVLATGAVAYIAIRLWRRGPRSPHDVAFVIAGILGSICYLTVVYFLALAMLFFGGARLPIVR